QRRARSKASTYHRATTLYSVDPCSDPDAAMRIEREAPRRWAQSDQRLSNYGGFYGSPPPRTVIGTDDRLTVEVPETMPLFCNHVGVIRRLPVFRRWSPCATARLSVCAPARRSSSCAYPCDDPLF